MSASTRTTYQGFAVDSLTRQILNVANVLLRLAKFGGEDEDVTMMQGSYSKGVSQSATTHDGGAVFDLTPFNWRNRVKVFRLLGMAYFDRPELWKNGKRYWPHHGHGVVCGMGNAAESAQDQVGEYYEGGDGLAGGAPDKDWRPAVLPILAVYGGNVGARAVKVTGSAWEQPQTKTRVRVLKAGTKVKVLMEVSVKGARWSVTDAGDFIPSSNLIATTGSKILPAQLIDLRNAKLTTPFGKEDHPTEIRQPALARFIDARCFFVRHEEVIFRVTGAGVTTENSDNPRCETREMVNSGRDEAEWDTRDGKRHVAEAEFMVSTNSKVVILQFHDAKDDVVMVSVEGSAITVEWSLGKDKGSIKKRIGTVAQGKRFFAGLYAEDGEIWVELNGVEKDRKVKARGGCYGKSGAYLQSDDPDHFAEVAVNKDSFKMGVAA